MKPNSGTINALRRSLRVLPATHSVKIAELASTVLWLGNPYVVFIQVIASTANLVTQPTSVAQDCPVSLLAMLLLHASASAVTRLGAGLGLPALTP